MPAADRLVPALFAAALPAAAVAADLGLPVTYLCGELAVSLAAGPDEARLRLGGRWMSFVQTETASGAKYVAEGAPEEWLWSKGGELAISLPGTGELTCSRAGPAPESFTAGGSEPGWRLDLAGGKAELRLLDGAAVGADHAAPEAIAGGRRIAFGDRAAEITDAICRDGATGMPHPHSVAVTGGETALRGCGGAPGELLGGLTWAVVALNGQPVPDGVAPDLRFEGETVAGNSGCNRFTGGFRLSGEGLTLGPLAMTRMACPEPQSATEQAMTAALAAVTRFDVTDDGGLILLAGDTPVLEARP
jgi:heat shock protein HslJ/membrane-bound inhibitor of C-type lysozyme